MKTLIEKLMKKFEEKGITLNLTGKEVMEKLGITYDDLAKYSDKYQMELYDNMLFEGNKENYQIVNEKMEFIDEVFWYEEAESLEPKYIDDGSKNHDDCNHVVGMVFMGGSFEYYSTDILDYFDVLKETKGTVYFTVSSLLESSLTFELSDGEIVASVFTGDTDTLTEEDKTILLYQLLVLSYNRKIEDTLSIIK